MSDFDDAASKPQGGYKLPPSIKQEGGVLRGESLAELSERIKEKKLLARQADPIFSLWQQWGLQLTQSYVPHSNLYNAATILSSDPHFKDSIWFDSFLQRVITVNGSGDAREWSDADDIKAAIHIQSEIGISRMSRDLVSQAVINLAHMRTKNCVTVWLDSLVHDGTARIDNFFSDHMGADESEYVYAASRNFWLSLVSRAYRPGCKVDNMIVLEGSQGVGKSSALQIIGGDWFAEQHESAANPKGFAEILQGKLLIEISEMDSFTRAEVNRVKQTVSCASDRFRASYGRYALDHPRTCIFVGTTNRDDWNRDETGARRFWPIRCKGRIALASISENRNQLFAEAVARYKQGEKHWLMPDELTREQQEDRYQYDPWLNAITNTLKHRTEITTDQIMDALNIEVARRDVQAQMRIGKCLRFLNWVRRRKRVGGDRAYFYEPSNNQEKLI